MYPTLRSRIQLELLHKLREKKGLARGFTLVELMIVVAIVGILSAVALPQFLGARDTASLGAEVGEQIGLAKECAVFVSSGGIGQAPANCTVAAGGTFAGTATGTATGVTCLDKTSKAQQSVSVSVAPNTGAITCAFS